MPNEKIIRLPYLGSRQDDEIFEYLLLQINERSALISIPNWLVSRSDLNDLEMVCLHLKQFSEHPLKGHARRIESHKSGYESLYRIQFSTSSEDHSSVGPWNFEGFKTRLVQIVKDCYLIKNGVFIYLKHLIPYFSRILKLSEIRYNSLKINLLNDVQQRVYLNMDKLQTLYQNLDKEIKNDQEIPLHLDLEKFRETIQSEINLDLFNLAFEDSPSIDKKKLEKLFSNSSSTFNMYLEAIKIIEKRLYDNYNCIVSLYTKAIQESRELL